MADNEKKDVKESVKKHSIKEFLSIVSMTPRDKWVVEKIIGKDKSLKSISNWEREMKSKCDGINYKKLN